MAGGRREFLRSVSGLSLASLTGIASASGLASASHSGTPIVTYDPWGSDNQATIKADDDGELNLSVNGSRVYDVEDPFWMDWDDEYLAVSDAGDIKVVDSSDRTPETETLTRSGNDLLPTISRDDLLFGRDDEIYGISNFASKLGGRSTPRASKSGGSLKNSFELPDGSRGGRNSGSKGVKGWNAGDYRVQVKLPNRGSSNNYFNTGPIWAVNLEIYKVNDFGSNTQLLNIHLGYEKQRNRHCIALFTDTNRRPRRVCAPNLKRLKRVGRRAVDDVLRAAKPYKRKIARLVRPAIKLAVRLVMWIGVAAGSLLFN